MRSSIVFAAVAAFLPAVFAQTNVPVCVVDCIGQASALTSCQSADSQCLCSSSTFIDGVSACMQQSCDTEELAFGVQFGEQYCQGVGVDVTIPASLAEATAGSTASATESTATSAVPTSAASSVASSVSSTSSPSNSASGSVATPSPTGTSGTPPIVKSAGPLVALAGLGAAFLI
ncbi:hypothetical protein JCM10212_001436 [Sporobolomyces blumeae]